MPRRYRERKQPHGRFVYLIKVHHVRDNQAPPAFDLHASHLEGFFRSLSDF